MRVHLVRHAMPDVDTSTDPAGWRLGAAGRRGARALDQVLPARAVTVTSSEPKAVETLVAATSRRPLIDPRFGEVRRPFEPSDGWHAARRAWVAGALDERHRGWETQADAAARFAEGVRSFDAEELVVGTHGMVMSAWLVSIGVWRPGEAAASKWESLHCPDVVSVDLGISGG